MIEILRPGVQTTVQDQGRFGYRHLGVAQSGGLDAPALMLANRLVTNPAHDAVLEIVVGPLEIRFHRETWFAICGADFSATLDGKTVHAAWRMRAGAGQVLRLNAPKNGTGCRAYLACDGGMVVEEVMGSRSTDIQGRFGGHHGRALKRGDKLALGAARLCNKPLGALQPVWTPEVRVVPGPEFELFGAAALHSFWTQSWLVSNQSNRMGYRLQGTALLRESAPGLQADLPSHAVVPGVVQVPPNGQPIVLLADSGATGGYPRIAVVIEADLWKLAQAPIGARFCFVETDLAGAQLAKKRWQQEQYRFEWSTHGR